MEPKEYLAEVRKLDPDTYLVSDLHEIAGILEVMEEQHGDYGAAYIRDEQLMDDEVAWHFIVDLEQHTGEPVAGSVVMRGLDYWFKRTNDELETQELLNQHR